MNEKTIALKVADILSAIYAHSAVITMMGENLPSPAQLPLLTADHRAALLTLVEQSCSMLSLHLCRYATDIDTAAAALEKGTVRYKLLIPAAMPESFETELSELMKRYVALSVLSSVTLAHSSALSTTFTAQSSQIINGITSRLKPMPPRNLRLTHNY